MGKIGHLQEGNIVERVGVHQLLDEKIVLVISQEIVFKDFLMGVYIPPGRLGIIINKTDVVMDGAVIDETGIIGQIKESPALAVGGIEEMPD